MVGFCEIEPFCQKVLKKHWPDVPVIDDIRKIRQQKPLKMHTGYDYGTVGLISGGFPCQPFSAAGQRRGTKDDRFLWPEMLRVISEVRPRWVVAENVAGLVSIDKGLVLERVFTDLEGEGYQVQPFIIPACAVGAPHRRDRIWIVAHDGSQRKKRQSQMDKNTGQGPEFRAEPRRKDSNAADTSQQLLHRPGVKREAGRGESSNDCEYVGDTTGKRLHAGTHFGIHSKEKGPRLWDAEPKRRDIIAPNPRRQGLQGGEQQGPHEEGPASYGSSATQCRDAWDEPWTEAASRLCALDDGLSPELAGREIDRNKYRTQKLKAVGNAIVPQVAYEIMKAIKEADK